MNESIIKTEPIRMKAISIVLLTIVISAFHYSAIRGNVQMHMIHRELYFFPILMAAFWFGLKAGVFTSVMVSIIYTPHVFMYNDSHSAWVTLLSQLLVFNLVSITLGWMVDRERKKRKERDFISETFGKFVDDEVRDEILLNRDSLDGEVREVTVLFADLRGFAKLVNSTAPKEVVRILNHYFKEMSEAIKKHQGLVLQFIGDEIEAVFGAPVSLDGHQLLAVNAALEMQRRLSSVNIKLINQGFEPLKHGIGIHTGKVLAANIGSPDRHSYAMIGDAVNMASRLQELSKNFDSDILISATTNESVKQFIRTDKLPPTKAKGYDEKLEIYQITQEAVYSDNNLDNDR